jgi:hypothetical protein
MFALVYTSAATAPFDESALVELARLASAKNRRLEITGYLTYEFESATFLQFLEGEKEAVEQLMATIEADSRHRTLSVMPILDEERQGAIRRTSAGAGRPGLKANMTAAPWPGERRLFPDWTMKLLSKDDFQRFNLEGELVEAMVALRQQSVERATTPIEVIRLSRLLAVRCLAWA